MSNNPAGCNRRFVPYIVPTRNVQSLPSSRLHSWTGPPNAYQPRHQEVRFRRTDPRQGRLSITARKSARLSMPPQQETQSKEVACVCCHLEGSSDDDFEEVQRHFRSSRRPPKRKAPGPPRTARPRPPQCIQEEACVCCQPEWSSDDDFEEVQRHFRSSRRPPMRKAPGPPRTARRRPQRCIREVACVCCQPEGSSGSDFDEVPRPSGSSGPRPEQEAPGPSSSPQIPEQEAPGPSPSTSTPEQEAPGPSSSPQTPDQEAPGPSSSLQTPDQEAPGPSSSHQTPDQEAPGPSSSLQTPDQEAPGPPPSPQTPGQEAPGPSSSPGPHPHQEIQEELQSPQIPTNTWDEEEELEFGNSSFLEYLEELCGDQDFIDNVECIVDPDYLLSDKVQEQLKQELEPMEVQNSSQSPHTPALHIKRRYSRLFLASSQTGKPMDKMRMTCPSTFHKPWKVMLRGMAPARVSSHSL